MLAGYDNGDVKMFDLRMNAVRWQANVGNGVCGVQFDRQDIEMNKFALTCLESVFKVILHHAYSAACIAVYQPSSQIMIATVADQIPCLADACHPQDNRRS